MEPKIQLQELKINLDRLTENKSDSKELIANLKKSFNSIESVLGKIEEYEKEFHCYCRINIMSLYILEHDLANLNLVKEMLNSFCDDIKFKDYDKFTSKLIEWEEYFYTEIYTPSDNYDEENLAKITNVLLN